jgi:hypothetical protein
MNTWSYSSLSLFKQCPRKYYRLRIAKDIIEPEAEHLIYGKEVHKVAEEYGRDGVKIPAKYSFIKPHIDALMEIEGDKYFEYEMGLTKDRAPCGFRDEAAWWRGIADFMVMPTNGSSGFIVDYKTSKSARYADTSQLEILSLAVFAHFPHIEKIKCALMFVVSEEFVPIEVTREDIPKMWAVWDEPTKRLEIAHESGVWNPSPNFTCRKWCPVIDCEHNGRA